MGTPSRRHAVTPGAPSQAGAGRLRRRRTTEGRIAAAFPNIPMPGARPGNGSALARLETRVALADHEDLATATDDLAVAVAGLRRFQGGQDLHDIPRKTVGANKPDILAGVSPPIQALAALSHVGGGALPYRMPRLSRAGSTNDGERGSGPDHRRALRLRQGHHQPGGGGAAGLALPGFRRAVPRGRRGRG